MEQKKAKLVATGRYALFQGVYNCSVTAGQQICTFSITV